MARRAAAARLFCSKTARPMTLVIEGLSGPAWGGGEHLIQRGIMCVVEESVHASACSQCARAGGLPATVVPLSAGRNVWRICSGAILLLSISASPSPESLASCFHAVIAGRRLDSASGTQAPLYAWGASYRRCLCFVSIALGALGALSGDVTPAQITAACGWTKGAAPMDPLSSRITPSCEVFERTVGVEYGVASECSQSAIPHPQTQLRCQPDHSVRCHNRKFRPR